MGLVLSRSASAAPCSPQGKITCPTGKTLVRTDTRECKANKFRTAAIVRRACCQNAKGKVKCKPYPKCPKKSCS